MKVCIHRGAREIGGNCVEVEAQGVRIVLDVGRPLDAVLDEEVPLPPVAGLSAGDDRSLAGVIISHSHQDHWGLARQIAPDVPLFMGAAAHRILQEAAFFSPAGADMNPAGFLLDRQPFQLGPFRITPYLVDHSAFDAYALLVEADGRRLFYTGDYRGHGRKSALFARLVRNPPQDIDVVLTEGTLLDAQGAATRTPNDERSVEQTCVRLFKATPGMALVVYSAQNIDRLVTLYRAALRADRNFVMDLYTATLARATNQASIPRPGPDWPRVKVFVPHRQRLAVKNAAEFERVQWVRQSRLYPEDLAQQKERLVMTFRGSMARDLEAAGCLAGAAIVWSLWPGYLESDQRLQAFQARQALPLVHAHCSGHAYPLDIQRLVQAMQPKRIVPMHTAAPAGFRNLVAPVDLHNDGEWWPV